MYEAIKHYNEAVTELVNYYESKLNSTTRIGKEERKILEMNYDISKAAIAYNEAFARVMCSIDEKLDQLLNK